MRLHHFRALTFNGVPVLGRWKCVHCGMKVKTYKQATVHANMECP